MIICGIEFVDATKLGNPVFKTYRKTRGIIYAVEEVDL